MSTTGSLVAGGSAVIIFRLGNSGGEALISIALRLWYISFCNFDFASLSSVVIYNKFKFKVYIKDKNLRLLQIYQTLTKS